MAFPATLPFPVTDALPLGAHRLYALTDEGLFEHCGVRIAFTSREGGVSAGQFSSLNCSTAVDDNPRAVECNRELVCEAVGALGAPLIVPNQVHGTDLVSIADVAEVERACAQAQLGADGVVVGAAGVAALLCFADCLPLIIVSPSGRFAVAHAGWRGAVGHIAAKAVRELSRYDGYCPDSYNAYIGPHIRSECFEVGEEVALRFRGEFGEGVLADERHVSLAVAVARDLEHAGLEARRICDCGVCTKCNPDRYFSYRATDGRCGRHCAVAFRR